MELKEAIEKLKGIDIKFFFSASSEVSDYLIDEADRVNEAIDTVLEELNNRIPRKDIEDKIKELKEKLENVRNKEDRIRNGVAIIVLEYCIDSMNELLNKE